MGAEPVMWIAGLRAAYLQALHPRVMRGTWQNTALADPVRAWGRFMRTVEFVQVRTYGTRAEVERAGCRVRKLHASLRGVDEDGSEFRLDEPDLLLWVHCAEVCSYVDIARRSGVPLTARELDAFVGEQRLSAAVVGLPPAGVPQNVASLDEYLAEMHPVLRVTAEARRALALSFSPKIPMPHPALKLAAPAIMGISFASLPRWARRRYGLPGSPTTDLAVTASLRALRQALNRAPNQLFVPSTRGGRCPSLPGVMSQPNSVRSSAG
jgi:uncharacterized protein (DUF2236 family)